MSVTVSPLTRAIQGQPTFFESRTRTGHPSFKAALRELKKNATGLLILTKTFQEFSEKQVGRPGQWILSKRAQNRHAQRQKDVPNGYPGPRARWHHHSGSFFKVRQDGATDWPRRASRHVRKGHHIHHHGGPNSRWSLSVAYIPWGLARNFFGKGLSFNTTRFRVL